MGSIVVAIGVIRFFWVGFIGVRGVVWLAAEGGEVGIKVLGVELYLWLYKTTWIDNEGGKESRHCGCQGRDILSQPTVVASVNDIIIEIQWSSHDSYLFGSLLDIKLHTEVRSHGVSSARKVNHSLKLKLKSAVPSQTVCTSLASRRRHGLQPVSIDCD